MLIVGQRCLEQWGVIMTNKEIKYLLGIDGGGTKTEFLLTDLNENEIKRTFLGASNPVNIGIENTKAVLQQGITEICEGFDFAEISVFAGLAGGGTGDLKTEINNFLGEFGFGAYLNGRDTDSVVKIALKDEDGVAMIMGTGIIAFSSCGGELHRVSGRGYLIDKGGCGFNYGSDALTAAFEYLDGRGESAIIFKLVEEKLGQSLDSSAPAIYAGGATFVASFAPVVFEAYKQGDDVARKILERNTYEVAKIIKTARKHLKNGGKTVICGGLCKQKEILLPFLADHLEGDDLPIFSDEKMIDGAVLIAKSIAENGEL